MARERAPYSTLSIHTGHSPTLSPPFLHLDGKRATSNTSSEEVTRRLKRGKIIDEMSRSWTLFTPLSISGRELGVKRLRGMHVKEDWLRSESLFQLQGSRLNHHAPSARKGGKRLQVVRQALEQEGEERGERSERSERALHGSDGVTLNLDLLRDCEGHGR